MFTIRGSAVDLRRGWTRRDCLRFGLGGALGCLAGRPIRVASERCDGGSEFQSGQILYSRLPVRRSQPHRRLGHETGRACRNPRRIQAHRHERPRCADHRTSAASGTPRRPVRRHTFPDARRQRSWIGRPYYAHRPQAPHPWRSRAERRRLSPLWVRIDESPRSVARRTAVCIAALDRLDQHQPCSRSERRLSRPRSRPLPP